MRHARFGAFFGAFRTEKIENFRGRQNFRSKSRKFSAKSTRPDDAWPRRDLCGSLQALRLVSVTRRAQLRAFSDEFRTEKNNKFSGAQKFSSKIARVFGKISAAGRRLASAGPRLCGSLRALRLVGVTRRAQLRAFSDAFPTEKITVVSNAPFSLRCALQRQRIRCNANAKNNALKQNFEKIFRQYPIFFGNCDVNTYDVY